MPQGIKFGEALAEMLRQAVMEEIKPRMDRYAADRTREVEASIDSIAEHYPNMDRTDMMAQLAALWAQSLGDGFMKGHTSIRRIADVLATLEYKVVMLEDILRKWGHVVPREPADPTQEDEEDASLRKGKTPKCDFCGGAHETPKLTNDGRILDAPWQRFTGSIG